MDGKQKLGEQLKLFRGRRQMTLQALSTALQEQGITRGCSVQHLSAIEHGNALPSAEVLRAIERALDAQGQLVSLLSAVKVPLAIPEGTIRVRAHLFYPLGIECTSYEELEQVTFQTPAFVSPKGKLTNTRDNLSVLIFPFHVAVLHECVTLEVEHLCEISMWRQEVIAKSWDYARQTLFDCTGTEALVYDKDPYCFTCFEVIDLPWHDQRTRRRAVQMLAVPTILAPVSLATQEARATFEEELLYAEDGLPDVVDFSGRDWLGAASWSAVAIAPGQGQSDLARDLIELQLQLQAVWCYCNCVELQGSLGNDQFGGDFLARITSALSRPTSTEHVSLATMRESIRKTSRIQPMIDSATTTFARRRVQPYE